MDVRSKTTIHEHLQREDAQERILQYIQKGRDEATVTISRAAELFGITENKLRDWEEYGFLNPLRPSGPKGRRLYTPAELDKLAIIRELIDAGYAASDIPANIDKLWLATRVTREQLSYAERQEQSANAASAEIAINQRISQGRAELFWRYYVSQTLRLSLMLISEDIPHTTVGLVLPLHPRSESQNVRQIEDLPALGETLVSWLSQSGSSHTLLTRRPFFQYTSDFRIERLQVMKAGVRQDPEPDEANTDPTLIVIQREAKPLTLSQIVVDTIRRLLQPIYENGESLRECFGTGPRDVLWPATNMENTSNEDVILNGLCDIIVHLGGLTERELPRWRFSSLFLPNYPSSILSLQQRSLVVQAQSEQAPYVIGVTTHLPQGPLMSTCIKAFQSGQSMYLPVIKATSQAQNGHENSTGSSIAMPIDDKDGTACAVLYVESSQQDGFNESDLRVLRMTGRMIREVLETYQVRQQVTHRLRDMLSHPAIVDLYFQDFQSEDNFIHHVEQILTDIQLHEESSTEANSLAFIAIDIDNQSSVANKYGDRMARDLTREVGLRIHSQVRAFKDATEYTLYHICADRFYLLLNNITLEQARGRAGQLRQTLEGSYSLDPQRTPAGQPTPAENIISINNITVRLGVAWYSYQKLKELVSRHPKQKTISEIRTQITNFLDEELAQGKQRGGNIVISWDPDLGFLRIPH